MRRLSYWIAFLILLLFYQPAYCYIDPASGNMLLQLIGGGLALVLLAFKLFWHRILSLFGLRKKEDQ